MCNDIADNDGKEAALLHTLSYFMRTQLSKKSHRVYKVCQPFPAVHGQHQLLATSPNISYGSTPVPCSIGVHNESITFV